MITIGVIDGQGGGIGTTIIRQIKASYGEAFDIIALGTNAIATTQMLKARANRGASGENAIIHMAARVDIIVGTVAAITSHAMMGEMTPRMARAVAASPARKVLLPLNQEGIDIVGVSDLPLPRLVEILVKEHLAAEVSVSGGS